MTQDQVRRVYRRRAARYDVTSHLYWALGYPLDRYRREGVAALRLSPGDTVVELGCGTGHNLPLLVAAVSAHGRVIGVDLTDAMLAQAHRRVARAGWRNVELVQSDAAAFAFPDGVEGVLSTYALTLVPGFDDVIGRAARALAPARRMVVVDFKAPERWPEWALRRILPLLRPFAVTLGLKDRRPWDSMRVHFGRVELRERYLGTTYVAVAEKTNPA